MKQEQWKLQSDVREYGHVLQIHQFGYMIVLQVDDLCMVGFANDKGNFVLPGRMPIVNDIAVAKALCEDMLKMDGGDAS